MGWQPASELSSRELEILELLATGVTNQRIGVELGISINTVKAHLRNIFAKLGVESRTEAALFAMQHGLIRINPIAESVKDEVVAEESLPPPDRVPWRLLPGQRLALLGALALVLLLAVWPAPRSVSSSTSSRLVDLPQGLGTDVEVEAGSRWQTKARMPTSRGRFAQAQVDGVIYVIAGLADDGWSNRVEAYYADRDIWERRAAKPIPVANVGAAAVNRLIYVPGGSDETGAVLDALEVYSPATDEWSEARRMPVALCAYAIAALEDGFYVFGGWNGHEYVDTVLYYDAVRDTWREEVPMQSARGFLAAGTVDGRIYVVGGRDAEHEYLLCESYEPALIASGQSPWREHPSMSVPRSGHGIAVAQGNLYVVGGGWEHPFAYNERFDVANEVWSNFESPFIGEWRMLGVSAMETRGGVFVYAIGGWHGKYSSELTAYQAFFRIYIP